MRLIAPSRPATPQRDRWHARPAPTAATTATATDWEHRPDIDGLRAVAVVLVVLFHASIGGMAGGFVGVDVFFVLSGFLITGLLLQELRATGRISLSAFYARRARRLLPAAALVLLATLVASAVLLPPLLVPIVAGDVVAAAAYVSNMSFAAQATDYFAAGGPPSPVLHYWSLGVEEQFYLFWPLLLLLVAGRPAGRGWRITITIAAVSLASLGLATWLTTVNAPLAFFSLPTRAWELGLGAILAVAGARLALMPRPIAAVAGWLGLAMIVLAGVAIAESAAFPGTVALLPTLGAALVIAGGARPTRFGAGRLLGMAVPRFFGRISYSLYLWHWPLLVVPAVAVGAPLALWVRVALVAAAVVLAWGTHVLVEDPLRRGRLIGTRPRRNLATAGALTLAVAVVSSTIGASTLTRLRGTGEAASPTANAEAVNSILDALESKPAAGGTAGAAAAVSAPPEGSAASPAGAATPTGSPTSGGGSRTQQPGPDRRLAGPVVPPGLFDTGSIPPTALSSVAPWSLTEGPSSAAAAGSGLSGGGVALGSGQTSALGAWPGDAPSRPSSDVSSDLAALIGPSTLAASGSPASGAAASGSLESVARPATPDGPVPADLQPAIGDARRDYPTPYVDGCHTQMDGHAATGTCTYGDPNATTTIALFGDSHALAWFPAVEGVAKQQGWRLLSLTMSTCSPADILIWVPDWHRISTECATWRQQAIERLQSERPAVVLVAGTRGFAVADASGTVLAGDARTRAWEAGIQATLGRLVPAAGKVIVLGDVPLSRVDPPVCLSQHTDSVLACATSVGEATNPAWLDDERRMASLAGAGFIDPSLWVCPSAPCPVVLGNVLIYRDAGHLTATFAQALSGRLQSAIARDVGEPRDRPGG